MKKAAAMKGSDDDEDWKAAQKALEAAGILFTDDEAGEIGVRLKTDKR